MYIQVKLQIEDSIVKDGVPKELQKTLLMLPIASKEYKFERIETVKHLIEAIYNEVKFVVDLKKVNLRNKTFNNFFLILPSKERSPNDCSAKLAMTRKLLMRTTYN